MDLFFMGLRARINEEKLTQEARTYVEIQNQGFAEEAFAQINPLIENYQKALTELGYSAQVYPHERGKGLSLEWADGQGALFLVHTLARGELSLEVASDDSRVLTGGYKIDRRDWDFSLLEKELQSFVTTFTDHAGHHGGLN